LLPLAVNIALPFVIYHFAAPYLGESSGLVGLGLVSEAPENESPEEATQVIEHSWSKSRIWVSIDTPNIAPGAGDARVDI
jgi:hypothetical protein